MAQLGDFEYDFDETAYYKKKISFLLKENGFLDESNFIQNSHMKIVECTDVEVVYNGRGEPPTPMKVEYMQFDIIYNSINEKYISKKSHSVIKGYLQKIFKHCIDYLRFHSIELPAFEYDIVLSFAGENRVIANEIAIELKKRDIKLFYDEFSKAELWGKDLTSKFKEIYGSKAKYVVILVSKYYPLKDWTNFEFCIARDESKKRNMEYILPIRLDDELLFGLKETVGYIRYSSSQEICDLIESKLKQWEKDFIMN